MKFLLIRLRRTGDVVLTTPAVSALRTAFPGASLTYLVEEPFARLVEDHPHIDRVLILGRNAGWGATARLLRGIRRERFDAVLDFHGGPRASYLTLLSGARIRVGYAVKYRRFFYTRRVPRAYARGPVHSVVNHLNLVRALGVKVDEPPGLVLPEARPEEKEHVGRLLGESAGGRRVILHVGAGNRFRDWGAENIARLIRLMDGLSGAGVVLAGSRDDLEAEADIRARAGRPVPSLVGRLNLIELREAILRSALFVGPDSGPMHIAASTPTPIVAVFGPTLPEHFAPWKARAVVLQKAMDCRPCRQRSCVTGDYRCLKSITPEDVFAACRTFL